MTTPGGIPAHGDGGRMMRNLLELARELWRAFVVWSDPGEHGRG